MNKPNYQDGSIVNLMSAICRACDTQLSPYEPHPKIPITELKEAKNIILLLIDGLGYQYIKRYGTNSTFHKYLIDSMTSVFPTTTASAITSITTATAPAQHAFTGWFMHLKEIGCVSAVLPFMPRVSMQPLGNAVSISDVFQLEPMFIHLKRLSFIVNQRRIINSEYSVLTSQGAERVAYIGLSDFFAQVENLAKYDDTKKYIYGYWPDFDALCHTHGIHSDIVKQHFNDLDELFSEFLKYLKGTDSVVIVTADHGLVETENNSIVHLDAHPELAKMLTLPLCGEPRAAYCYVKSNQTKAFESYVQMHLSSQCELHRSDDLITQHYFGLGTPNEKLSDRIGDYTLIMKNNHVIKDTLLGEKPFVQIGVHGGLSDWELQVPLIYTYC